MGSIGEFQRFVKENYQTWCLIMFIRFGCAYCTLGDRGVKWGRVVQGIARKGSGVAVVGIGGVWGMGRCQGGSGSWEKVEVRVRGDSRAYGCHIRARTAMGSSWRG